MRCRNSPESLLDQFCRLRRAVGQQEALEVGLHGGDCVLGNVLEVRTALDALGSYLLFRVAEPCGRVHVVNSRDVAEIEVINQ